MLKMKNLVQSLATVLCVILCCSMFGGLLTCSAEVAYDGTATALVCDVNGDGAINIKDLVRLKKYFAGMATDISQLAADVDGSGTVLSQDMVLLRQYLLGITSVTTDGNSFSGLYY